MRAARGRGVLLMARQLDLGGSERQLTETARRLREFGFEPHAACLQPGGMRIRELEAASVPVLCLSVHSFGSPAAIRGAGRLVSYIRERGIGLVHTFDWPATVFAIPVVRAFTRAAAVSSQRAHRDLTPAGWRRMVKFTDRLAHAVVVNCEFVRRSLIEEEKTPADKVRVCYNGIDVERFHPGSRMDVDDRVTIGTVSALRPEKGLDLLISAFAAVRGVHPGVRLAIVGSGECLPALEEQARRAGIVEDCTFEPATRDAASWFRRMDIMALPSRTEALSNSLMEAMACGCCVAASRVGGNPELVEHGVTGMLFEPGNSADLAARLDAAIRDIRGRREMGAAAARFIRERFSLNSAVRRMAGIYDGLLGDRALRAASGG